MFSKLSSQIDLDLTDQYQDHGQDLVQVKDQDLYPDRDPLRQRRRSVFGSLRSKQNGELEPEPVRMSIAEIHKITGGPAAPEVITMPNDIMLFYKRGEIKHASREDFYEALKNSAILIGFHCRKNCPVPDSWVNCLESVRATNIGVDFLRLPDIDGQESRFVFFLNGELAETILTAIHTVAFCQNDDLLIEKLLKIVDDLIKFPKFVSTKIAGKVHEISQDLS